MEPPVLLIRRLFVCCNRIGMAVTQRGFCLYTLGVGSDVPGGDGHRGKPTSKNPLALADEGVNVIHILPAFAEISSARRST